MSSRSKLVRRRFAVGVVATCLLTLGNLSVVVPHARAAGPDTAPAFTSASSATFTVGAAGPAFAVTADGQPAPTFAANGLLPEGLTLSSLGVLSGTPEIGSNGIYHPTFIATNGILPDAQQPFELTVLPAASVPSAPVITSAASAGADEGEAGFSFEVTTTGAPAASLTELGALPGGVTFVDHGSGAATISGAPAAGTAGTYPFVITATNGTAPDATQPFTLTIGVPVRPTVTGVSPTMGPEQGGNEVVVTGTGFGSVSSVHFVLSDSTSYAGTIDSFLTSDTSIEVVVPSVPAGAGTVDVTVSNLTQTSAVVRGDRYTFGTFFDPSPPDGVRGIAYGFAFGTNAGTSATYSVGSGALPAGLSLGARTGELSGVPTTVGTSTFSLTASVDDEPVAISPPISLTVLASPIGPTHFMTPTQTSITVRGGTPYGVNFQADGTPDPIYRVTAGRLPDGMTLGRDGLLYGAARATPAAPGTRGNGYWLIAADGGVFSFGDAKFHGSTGGMKLVAPIVAMAATASGNGYWLIAADGGVFSFGDAKFHGSTGGMKLVAPIVAMAATASGNGYWLIAADGGVFSFGDAKFHGSTGGLKLVAPIVAMAATASGNGYWLIAADGGVFSFGDAKFHGSTGGMKLVAPIVAMAATASGNGYWLIAADGGVFSFGDAKFHGSTGGMKLVAPIVAMAATASGNGYWLIAADGGVFSFGDAKFHGSTGGMKLVAPIVAMRPSPVGSPSSAQSTFPFTVTASNGASRTAAIRFTMTVR